MSSLRLSEKYGVNPGLEQCFYCLEPKGVILFGRLPGDKEAPRQACINYEPCDKCKEWMKQGVIFISIDEAKTTDDRNPHRTGGWIVLKEAAVKCLPISQEVLEGLLKKRICFMVDEAWDRFGFPRGTEQEEGVKAIIALQKMAGIEETEEKAREGWFRMSADEKEQTMRAFRMLAGRNNADDQGSSGESGCGSSR